MGQKCIFFFFSENLLNLNEEIFELCKMSNFTSFWLKYETNVRSVLHVRGSGIEIDQFLNYSKNVSSQGMIDGGCKGQ